MNKSSQKNKDRIWEKPGLIGIGTKRLKDIFIEKKDENATAIKGTKRNSAVKRKNNKKRNVEVKSIDKIGKSGTEISVIQEKVRIALRERNQLECNILALIGGKDGLLSNRNQVILLAQGGDVQKFCFYANAYLQRVERLKIEFDNLIDHMERDREEYRRYKNKEPLVKLLLMPYENKKECRKLIAFSEELRRRKLLDPEKLSEEMLCEFYEWSRRFDEKAE